jgi:hypothetical protein
MNRVEGNNVHVQHESFVIANTAKISIVVIMPRNVLIVYQSIHHIISHHKK